MAKTSTKKAKDKPEVTLAQVQEFMETRQKCTCCGKILEITKNFYVSYSLANAGQKRMPLCKDCLRSLLVSYIKESEDIRLGIYKTCRNQAIFYNDDRFNEAYNEAGGYNEKLGLVENGLEVWKKYIKNVNSLTQNSGLTFDEGQFIDLSPQTEEVVEVKKPSELTSEELEQKMIFKRNKEDIIKICGYYPFENETNQELMCSNLVTYLADDEVKEDSLKLSAVISIIKSQQQENKINDVISSLSSDIKQIADNIGTIKELTTVKEKISKSYLALAKDNGISELYSGKKTVGGNTLTGTINKLKNIELKESQVNLFDIRTSIGMEQVARQSMKGIVDNLMWGDDTSMEMIRDQRILIDKYYKQSLALEEQNRKLRVLCNYHGVDYKEDMGIQEADWEELKPSDELTKEDLNQAWEEYELENKSFEEKVKEEVQPMTVMEYSDEIEEQKEEEYKQKILEELANEEE